MCMIPEVGGDRANDLGLLWRQRNAAAANLAPETATPPPSPAPDAVPASYQSTIAPPPTFAPPRIQRRTMTAVSPPEVRLGAGSDPSIASQSRMHLDEFQMQQPAPVFIGQPGTEPAPGPQGYGVPRRRQGPRGAAVGIYGPGPTGMLPPEPYGPPPK